MLPTLLLGELYKRSAEVKIRLKGASVNLAERLGPYSVIFKCALASENVFITRYSPNMGGPPSIGSCKLFPFAGLRETSETGEHRAIPTDNRKSCRLAPMLYDSPVNYLSIRITPRGKAGKSVAAGCIEIRKTPFLVTIGSSADYLDEVDVPVPLEAIELNRIGHLDDLEIGLNCEMAHLSSLSKLPEYLYPVQLREGTPVLHNLYYSCLDRWPTLDLTKEDQLQWLGSHIFSSLYSAQEAQSVEQLSTQGPASAGSRLLFKRTLEAIFRQYADGKGRKTFGIGLKKGAINHVLIYPSCMRLDLNTRAVVLDAAVLPWTKGMNREIPKLLKPNSNGLTREVVDNSVLLFWKYALAAYVESCRTWEHLATCAYRTKGRVPISTNLGAPVLCSCGVGKFPGGYEIDHPEKEQLLKFCTRAAIQLCFPSPFFEGRGAVPPRFSSGLANCGGHSGQAKDNGLQTRTGSSLVPKRRKIGDCT